MKKIITLILSLALVLNFAACGNGGQGQDLAAKPDLESAEENVSEPEESKETETPSSDSETENADAKEDVSGTESTGETLVVYYSASGNTEEVANYIAAATGGDIFKLEPAEPYSDADLDWTDDGSRVCREHENEDERNVELVSDTAPNWDSYETVFIGYPIWWGIAAWPVNNFIKANDFSGKTVIPFCTSASSGLGESGKLLSELAGTGDWQEGERFQSGVSEEDVKAWIESLD